MIKCFLGIIVVIFSIQLSFGMGSSPTSMVTTNYYSLFDNGHVSIDIFNTNSLTYIDKVHNYNYQNMLLNEVSSIIAASKDQVYLEYHLGFNANYCFKPLIISNVYSNYYTTSENMANGWGGNIAIKINLFNPKRPNADYLLSRITYLNELMTQTGMRISDNNMNKLKIIEKQLEDYKSEFWYKRLSIGLGVPLDFGYSYRYYTSYPAPNAIVDQFYRFLHLNDMYVFVGYDISDICTIQFGGNDHMVLTAISFDISTPVSYSSSQFISFLRGVFRN